MMKAIPDYKRYAELKYDMIGLAIIVFVLLGAAVAFLLTLPFPFNFLFALILIAVAGCPGHYFDESWDKIAKLKAIRKEKMKLIFSRGSIIMPDNPLGGCQAP